MSKIAGIYWDDTAAAPGISLSVYFSGCHFHCPGCHNPEAQDFEYGEDFTMGDTVQVANEYGHESAAYISEIIISQDNGGISIYPTFKTITEEGETE